MIAKRHLGADGPVVGCLGYGAMVIEGYYGASDDEQAVATIRGALDALARPGLAEGATLL